MLSTYHICSCSVHLPYWLGIGRDKCIHWRIFVSWGDKINTNINAERILKISVKLFFSNDTLSNAISFKNMASLWEYFSYIQWCYRLINFQIIVIMYTCTSFSVLDLKKILSEKKLFYQLITSACSTFNNDRARNVLIIEVTWCQATSLTYVEKITVFFL